MHRLISLVFVLVLVLGACQPVTVQRGDGRMPLQVRVDDAAYWLEEWHRVSRLDGQAVRLTLARREEENRVNPNARNNLRLALLLAAGPREVRDLSRARSLARAAARDGQASPSARALAALLDQFLGEQLWAGDKINTLREKLEQSGARVQELERQLQELTDIEQSIQQRN
ncbi:MAG TPA: hypothetical protein ENJ79_02440 [Gammaproteobacteria bacterium]|nr:hypothetical protein [Gammaproteobacteria bacterium]